MSETLPRPGEADAPASSPHRRGSSAADDRFERHVGVRVDEVGDRPCGCGAIATLTDRPAWLGPAGADADTGPGADNTGADGGVGAGSDPDGGAVPTGAVLALVDAAARGAAQEALSGHDGAATLVAVATGVQYRSRSVGPLTATATVPCEGEVVDRADRQGVLRFSVAVTVVDRHGDRTATGTVQWLATLAPPHGPDATPALTPGHHDSEHPPAPA